MDKDFIKMLKRMGVQIEGGGGPGGITFHKNRTDAIKDLEKYESHKRDFEVGDYVEQNEYGRQHRFPEKENHQVAKVIEIFDEEVFSQENNIWCDMRVRVVVAENVIMDYLMPSKHYKKVNIEKNVVPFWGKNRKKGD